MVSRHEPSGATSLPPRTALRTSSPRLVQISPSRPAPSPTPCWPITERMAAICAAARASGATAAASSTRPRELEWPFAATASSVGEFAGIRPENHQSSWRFGSSGPSLVDFADDFEIAIGHHRGVKRAMRGLKLQGATVDDAVEAARAAAARGRPLDGPAGLQVASAVEADDVRAQHVTVERDGTDLVVVPTVRPACMIRSCPIIRSPGTKGLVGKPMIGPVVPKNWMAVSWLSKLNRLGACASACVAATPPVMVRAAAAPSARQVRAVDIGRLLCDS